VVLEPIGIDDGFVGTSLGALLFVVDKIDGIEVFDTVDELIEVFKAVGTDDGTALVLVVVDIVSTSLLNLFVDIDNSIGKLCFV